MRNPLKLTQPKRNTTTFGLRSLSYLGPKLWNHIMNDPSFSHDIGINEFKALIGSWDGPSDLSLGNYL